MGNKGKKNVQKYTALYMSTGMCFGVSFGLLFGMFFYPDNIAMGMCLGLPVGMCFGIAAGAAKDKKLSENMMEVGRIEAVQESSDLLIYVTNKNGEEKEYRVSEKKMKKEKFSIGDRVAEETDGSLVSLEE